MCNVYNVIFLLKLGLPKKETDLSQEVNQVTQVRNHRQEPQRTAKSICRLRQKNDVKKIETDLSQEVNQVTQVRNHRQEPQRTAKFIAKNKTSLGFPELKSSLTHESTRDSQSRFVGLENSRVSWAWPMYSKLV
jgi:hypothetical protein